MTPNASGTSGSSTARRRPAAPHAVVRRCSSGACSDAAGKLTAFGTASPRRAASVVTLITSPTAASASALEPPICGVTTAAGIPKSGLVTAGSCGKTSTPAPRILPLASASASASSSTTPPRAALITIASGLSLAIASRFSR